MWLLWKPLFEYNSTRTFIPPHSMHICATRVYTHTHCTLPLCHMRAYFLHQWFKKRQQIHNKSPWMLQQAASFLIRFLPVRLEYLPTHRSVRVFEFGQISEWMLNKCKKKASVHQNTHSDVHNVTRTHSHIFPGDLYSCCERVGKLLILQGALQLIHLNGS